MSWGWRIVILYAIFIAGTVGWVSYAMTKEVDLVRPDYYEHGLEHDKSMAARARADALGTNASIQLDAAHHDYRIQLPAEQAAAAKGTILLYRPNSIESDRTIPLAVGSDGIMRVPTSNLAPGLWQITLDWQNSGLSYEMQQMDTLRQ
ncbi:MAG: FixH family protein [Candidatus Kapaibacterium sp.]